MWVENPETALQAVARTQATMRGECTLGSGGRRIDGRPWTANSTRPTE
jgi:hypothetical protein